MENDKIVNMNTCEPGDLLITKHGLICKYIKYRPNTDFPHIIQYPGKTKSLGSRTDEGWVGRLNRLETDHDIIKIIKKYF